MEEARLAEISRDDKRRAAPQEARTILHGHVWFGSQLSGMGELLDGEVRETSGTNQPGPKEPIPLEILTAWLQAQPKADDAYKHEV